MAVQLEDRPGGQVRIETGRGLVTGIEGNDGDRNRRVLFKATHANLTDPITGWADTTDGNLWSTIVEAFRGGFELAYRVEVKRKPDAPTDKPIAELGNRQKVRELVSVERAGSAAAGPSPGPEASPTSTDTREAGSGPQNAAESPAESGRRGGKVQEGKPWEEMNTDGSINVGSYGVQAAAGMVELAVDLLTPEGGPPPAFGKVKNLAATLLGIADEVQAGARRDGRADRLDGSHARARGCLRTALRFYPPPLGGTEEERAEWRRAVVDYAGGLLKVAVIVSTEGPDV